MQFVFGLLNGEKLKGNKLKTIFWLHQIKNDKNTKLDYIQSVGASIYMCEVNYKLVIKKTTLRMNLHKCIFYKISNRVINVYFCACVTEVNQEGDLIKNDEVGHRI